jgi:uncharacterized repeat protein (TIGR02543 family)
MKTRAKIPGILLMLAMALSMLPAVAFAATGTMSIAGETDVNLGIDHNNGTGWAWDADGETLTLGSDYNSANWILIECDPDDTINMELNGNVAINDAGNGASVWVDGSLIIKAGSYELNMTDINAYALRADNSIVIESGTVVANGIGSGILSYYGDITVKGNARVRATANEGFGLGSQGIYAVSGNIIVSDNANVETIANTTYSGSGLMSRNVSIRGNAIVTATVNATGYGYGILAEDVMISDNAKVTLTANGDGGGLGIYAVKNIYAVNNEVTISTINAVQAIGSTVGIAGIGVHISDGTVTAKGNFAGIHVFTGGLNITGGNVNVGDVDSNNGDIYADLAVSAGADVTVNGDIKSFLNDGDIIGGSLTVSGGAVAVTGGIDGDLDVSDGTVGVTGEVNGQTTVTGGDVTVGGHDLFAVTFDPNGGTFPSIVATTGADGKLASLPAQQPTRSGYTFSGWYTATNGGEQVSTDTVFRENTTVYARWTSDTTGNGGSNGGGGGGNNNNNNNSGGNSGSNGGDNSSDSDGTNGNDNAGSDNGGDNAGNDNSGNSGNDSTGGSDNNNNNNNTTGNSSGGCDAGIANLTVLAVAAFGLKRKARKG